MNAQLTLLGFLGISPNYGYELKKLYDKLFGQEKPILSGQVYSTLTRLQKAGAIRKVPDTDASGGPERVKYEITSRGQEVFQQWLATPEQPAPDLQAVLYVKTVLALMSEGEAASYLDAQKHTHIERMRTLIRQRRLTTVAEAILIDHAIFHIEADLRWIELTSSRLHKLKEELCR
jgi:DNA-binding PadR family transcriptional regulator